MPTRPRASAGIFFALVLVCPLQMVAQRVLFEGVTVIDPESRRVLEDHRIVVRGERIRRLEPVSRPRPRGRIVDAEGLYAIPGLLDLHVHLNLEALDQQGVQRTLDLLLDHGITGVRDMASDCWPPTEGERRCLREMRRLQRDLESGLRRGPRLLRLASGIVFGGSERHRLVEGSPPHLAPETFDEGVQLARELRRRGVDLIKIYNSVPRDAYLGIHRGAREVEVSGHLPLGVSVEQAARAGHRTVEHARDLPVACSRYGTVYRDTMHRVLAGDLSAEPPDAETRLRRALETFDDQLCERVLRTLAEAGTWLVPTHGTREMDARAAEPAYRAGMPDDLPEALRERWLRDLDDMAEVAPRLGELYERFYRLGIELTGRAHRAGVRVLVGTDANDTMIVPGRSLHEELERFAEAGLEPMDILRAATTLPARYLGERRLGGLSAGKRADFLLLRASPLADISKTREIETVVLGGRVVEPSD